MQQQPQPQGLPSAIVGPDGAPARIVGPPERDLLLDCKTHVLPLVFWPEMKLGQKCEPVETFDDELSELVGNMAHTLYAMGGVGLAAPQVGSSKRVVVVDIFNQPHKHQEGMPPAQLLIAINPRIEWQSAERKVGSEACLSLPGMSMKPIERFTEVRVRAWDRHGKEWALHCGGLLGRALQHEIDHLDGVTILDRMKPYDHKRAIDDLKKFRDRVSKA